MRPFVWVNCAASLDGKIALADRRPLRLSDRDDLVRVHRLRAASDAILVGIGTVLQDDPHLTVKREYAAGANPLRVVLDTRGRTPPGALVVNNAAPTLIVTGDAGAEPPAPHVETLACGNHQVDLERLLDHLGARGVRQLLVEGGEAVLWSFLGRGLADRLTVFTAPLLIGGVTSPTIAGGRGCADSEAVRRLRLAGVERVGAGAVLTYERE